MFQRDRERSLDCNHRVTTNQSTNQKPSPLGEGGADRRRKGGARSQTKTAPQPRHQAQLTTQTKSHQIRKAIHPRKRAPPTEP